MRFLEIKLNLIINNYINMKNISIVVWSFHKREANIMVKAAKTEIEKRNCNLHKTVWVPWSYESPLAIKRELHDNKVDAVVILWIIERWETTHWIVMAQSVSSALLKLSLKYNKPLWMGILWPEIFPSQVESRISSYSISAANAAIDMLN